MMHALDVGKVKCSMQSRIFELAAEVRAVAPGKSAQDLAHIMNQPLTQDVKNELHALERSLIDITMKRDGQPAPCLFEQSMDVGNNVRNDLARH